MVREYPAYSTMQEFVRASIVLIRPYNALPPIAIYLIGYVSAGRLIFDSDLIVGIIVIFLAHTIATVWNDIEDKDIDRTNKRSNILIQGRISDSDAWFAIALIILIGTVISITKGTASDIVVFVIFLVGSWLYNHPPAQFSRRPIMSITILGLLFGTIPFLYGACSGNLPVHTTILAALAFFMQRIAVSVLKDYKDIKGDKEHHKKTFLIQYGPRVTAWFSIIGSLAANVLLMIVFFSYFRFNFVAGLLSVVIAISLGVRLKLLNSTDHAYASSLFRKIFVLENIFNIGLLVCLI